MYEFEGDFQPRDSFWNFKENQDKETLEELPEEIFINFRDLEVSE